MASMNKLITLGMSVIILSWNEVPDNVAPTDFHIAPSSTEQCLSFDNSLEISSLVLANKLAEREIRLKYLARLAELANLEDNWDGNGAPAISPKVLAAVTEVVHKVPTDILNFWRLFPELNGTLLFSAKNKLVMGMSIGEKEFSYVGRYGGKRVKGKLHTNIDEIIKVLTELKEMIA